MSKKNTKAVDNKNLRNEITSKLVIIFTDIKATIGEKKFAKNVKKASKILASGKIKKTAKKDGKHNKKSDGIVVGAAAMS